MATFRNPTNGDVRVVPAALDKKYAARGWEPQAATPADELKGKALDDALKNAGLPTTGSADEKRARLTEHQGEHGE